MGVKTVCPHCGKNVTIFDGRAYKANKGKCPKCKKLVRRSYQLNCPKCNNSIKVIWGPVRRGEAKCPRCDTKITKLDLFKVPSTAPQAKAPRAKAPQAKASQAKAPATSFKQTGVLCLSCMNVTNLGNKKCQSCRNKLKVKPSTMVYFNGHEEAVQCQKCGKYTNFRGIKCDKCRKKLKF